jgi:hypothetical protein
MSTKNSGCQKRLKIDIIAIVNRVMLMCLPYFVFAIFLADSRCQQYIATKIVLVVKTAKKNWGMLFRNKTETMHSMTIKSLNLSNLLPNSDFFFRTLARKPSKTSENPINNSKAAAKIALSERYAKIKNGSKISLDNVTAFGMVNI